MRTVHSGNIFFVYAPPTYVIHLMSFSHLALMFRDINNIAIVPIHLRHNTRILPIGQQPLKQPLKCYTKV